MIMTVGGREGLGVLVVDDDGFVGRAVACILREARRARVWVTRSGDEALPVAAQQLPELILADVNMPGMDVVDLCRALREMPCLSATPIYLLTGMLPDSDRLEELMPLVQGVLTKPPDPAQLVRIVDQCLSASAGASPSQG